MKDIYVVEALRTPFGSFSGILADVEAPKLAAAVLRELLAKTGLGSEAVDEVIIGQVLSGGCGQAPARQAMRGMRGFQIVPMPLPSTRSAAAAQGDHAGSGRSGLAMHGSDGRRHGEHVAGAVPPQEGRSGYRMGNGELFDLMIYDGLQDPYSGRHMGVIAEASAGRNGITREEQDDFALRSYRLAQAAVKEGVFADEIVPVVKGQGGKIASRRRGAVQGGFPNCPNCGGLPQGRHRNRREFLHHQRRRRPDSPDRCGGAESVQPDTEGTHGCLRHDSRHPDQFTEAPVGAIEKACARAGLTSATSICSRSTKHLPWCRSSPSRRSTSILRRST